ncbi:MAG TPA: nucleotidyltransferase family protein [Levilinea sp.]|nr:nucleotidyltransferase family protein [Levilinea sp.]
MIVTAGGITRPDEPLYPLCGAGYKALLQIDGKPMVQWVLDAISASPRIERVVVVGLPSGTPLVCRQPLGMLKDHNDAVENICSAVSYLLKDSDIEEKVLVISADIPAVTAEMIEWLIDRVEESDHDLYYNVIRREVMEKRYPGSKRTYFRLKDGEFCGGDASAVRKAIATHAHPLFKRLMVARKNPLRQAGLIGLDTMLLLLFRQLTIQEGVRRVGRRLDIRGHALDCPFAELGMDVDKPFQLAIIQKDLEGSQAA